MHKRLVFSSEPISVVSSSEDSGMAAAASCAPVEERVLACLGDEGFASWPSSSMEERGGYVSRLIG